MCTPHLTTGYRSATQVLFLIIRHKPMQNLSSEVPESAFLHKSVLQRFELTRVLIRSSVLLVQSIASNKIE